MPDRISFAIKSDCILVKYGGTIKTYPIVCEIGPDEYFDAVSYYCSVDNPDCEDSFWRCL